jgi:proline iminopeptidase
MKIKIIRLLKYLPALCTVIFLWLIFFPRTYNMPVLKQRAGTQYWNLQTGSRIGYTLLTAKGNRKSYPVIYLQGGPGGHISDTTIKILSGLSDAGYDVYLYDPAGSGQSARLDNIREYTAERHKIDLEEIVKKTGSQKVILIGQSWGAVLAVLFAADNPGLVEKIIFTCPGPIYPVNMQLTAEKAPDSLHLKPPLFTNAQGNKKANNLRTKAMKIMAAWFGIKLAPDKEADAFETYLNYEVDKSAVYDIAHIRKPEAGAGFYARVMTFNSLQHLPDPRPKLKDVNIPVMVMKAQYDNQPWGFTNEYCAVFKNHQLVIIPNAGHAILFEQPGLYLKNMLSFLNQ